MLKLNRLMLKPYWPEDTTGHLVLTRPGPIEDALIRRAQQAGVSYVMLVADVGEALTLYDQGYKVMIGNTDDPATYRAARLSNAALLSATWPDTTNANIIFTAREISADVPVVATATKQSSVDVLELAEVGPGVQRAFLRVVSERHVDKSSGRGDGQLLQFIGAVGCYIQQLIPDFNPVFYVSPKHDNFRQWSPIKTNFADYVIDRVSG